jgi:hypothetical protein
MYVKFNEDLFLFFKYLYNIVGKVRRISSNRKSYNQLNIILLFSAHFQDTYRAIFYLYTSLTNSSHWE